MPQSHTRTWFITGCSRGLGRALVQAVLEAGDRVIATARQPAHLEDIVRQYGANRIRTVALDVTDATATKEAIESALKDGEFGLDIVVNNAGFADIASAEDMSDEVFRAQVDTNFYGVVNVTKAVLPILRKQRHGHIIQISSVGGRVGGTPGLSAYQAAKFAVDGYSRVVAAEVKPLGIKVTIVEPGGFKTDWAGSSMKLLPYNEDYEPTVGAKVRQVKEFSAYSNGDPARAAKAILEVVNAEEPPLHLVLGSDALRVSRDNAAVRAAELEKWARVSASTDFAAANI